MPGRILHAYRDAYSGLPRELWLLSLTMFVNRAGSMVLAFFSLYLTQELGFTASQAGLVLGGYGVGSMLGAWIGGWLSDRLDPNFVQRVTLIVGGVGFLFVPMFGSFLSLTLYVFAIAIVIDAFRPAVMVAAVRYSAPEERPRAFAMLRLAMSLGMSVGPAVGGILAAWSYDWIFYVDGGTCLVAAGLHMLLLGSIPLSEQDRHEASTRPARPVWQDGPYLAFLAMVVVVVIVIFQLLSTWPLYLRDAYLLSEARIGLLFGLNSILIALVEMVLMKRLQTRNLLRVAAWGALIVCAGMAILPLGPPRVWVAVVSLLVWTLGEMLFLPVTLSVAGNRASASSTGRYLGAYAFCFSLALVLAPVIGTGIYERLGGMALWLGIGGLGPLFWIMFRLLSDRFAPLPRPASVVE